MPKRSFIIIQGDKRIPIEYTDIRYEGYKKILDIWSHTDGQIALAQVMRAVRYSPTNVIFRNHLSTVKKLGKTGLFSYTETDINFFTGFRNFEVADIEFIDGIFYRGDSPSVWYLATLILVESKIQNGQEIMVETEVGPSAFCCCNIL